MIANTLIQTICTERNHMPSPLYDVWKSLEPLTTTLLYFLPIIFDLLIQVYLFEGSLYLGTPSSFCIKFDVEWRSHRRILPCFLPSIDRATLYLLKHLPGLRTHRITPARDCYVVVALARNCSSTAISNVFFRKIDSSGSGGGKPLKLKNRTFWINEEVKNEALKVGYLLENRDATCRQSLLGRRGKLFIFYRNAGCKPQVIFHYHINSIQLEIKGVACHLENALTNWPHTCNIPLRQELWPKFYITTHEWPGPRSQVLNMVRTQPVQKDCL